MNGFWLLEIDFVLDVLLHCANQGPLLSMGLCRSNKYVSSTDTGETV